MNGAEAAVQRERIERFTGSWRSILGRGLWQIDFVYVRGPISGMAESVVACVTTKWEYLAARLEFNLELTATLDDQRMEHEVVHELCHILVAEIIPTGLDAEHSKHEERVVTMLATAFLAARYTQVGETVSTSERGKPTRVIPDEGLPSERAAEVGRENDVPRPTSAARMRQ